MRQTCEILTSHGAEVLMPREVAMLGEEALPIRYLDLEHGVDEADAMVVLGGDGTILRIAGLAAQYGTPILGVNMGHVGFMTELEPGEISLVSRLCTGRISNRQPYDAVCAGFAGWQMRVRKHCTQRSDGVQKSSISYHPNGFAVRW